MASVLDKAIYAVARLSRHEWDARMESAAHHRPSSHHGDGFVGVIYGDIGTTAFRCSVAEGVERNEFVQVRHETCGIVLGRVDEVQRKTDLSLDRAQALVDGEAVASEGGSWGQINMTGYPADGGLRHVPGSRFPRGDP